MVSTDKSVAMTGFFEEVKRRKVYRVAAAYIIAAGGHYATGFCRVSRMGIAKLGAAPGDRAVADGFSGRADACVGVRHHRAGRSGNTRRLRRPGSHRRRNMIMLVAAGVIISAAAGFFLLPRVSAHKMRQINCSVAV